MHVTLLSPVALWDRAGSLLNFIVARGIASLACEAKVIGRPRVLRWSLLEPAPAVLGGVPVMLLSVHVCVCVWLWTKMSKNIHWSTSLIWWNPSIWLRDGHHSIWKIIYSAVRVMCGPKYWSNNKRYIGEIISIRSYTKTVIYGYITIKNRNKRF